MRPSDFLSAATMHASARFTVRYGAELAFAGGDLPRPRTVRVRTRHGRVPVQVYAGGDASRAPYVHLHGGAWLMRHPRMDDWWCRYLAAEAGVTVLNVDFRTGPYVAYPVAQEQSHDVAAWASSGAGSLGLAGDRLVVGGFSSGGGMAAAVCLMARDAGSFAPVLQVLGCPALDLASDVPAGAGMISPRLRELVRRVYFPDPATRAEPYASPVLAPDLTGLPPAIVLTGERDTLRRDGETYARRLREAGVEVTYDCTPHADHYFLTEDPDRARTTMAMVAAEVRRRTAGPA